MIDRASSAIGILTTTRLAQSLLLTTAGIGGVALFGAVTITKVLTIDCSHVDATTGSILHIENCRIFGFRAGSARGISYTSPTASLVCFYNQQLNAQ